jgi:hypothetical protein
MSEYPDRSRWRLLFWALALGVVCFGFGPRMLDALRPEPTTPLDFFQEWASARYFFDGRPVYAPQDQALESYLGVPRKKLDAFLEVNAHPPTSVLLALPFAALSYPNACLAWNLLSWAALVFSLAILLRQLGLPLSVSTLLPVLTLLLLCHPLREQTREGQYNLFLLALIVGGWAAERSGRPWCAGVLLGCAAVLKLFPTFLLLPFLLRGRWRVLLGAAAAAMAWTALTLLVLGPGAYRDYVEFVLPHLQRYHVAPRNLSLTGFWSKVCLVAHALLGYDHRLVLRGLIAVSCLAVTGLAAWRCAQARSREAFDQAFALAVIAMLLVSPITWCHAFLLLLLPAALFAASLPAGRGWRLALGVCLAFLFLPHIDLWQMLCGRLGVDDLGRPYGGPLHSLVTILFQQAALFAFFVLGARIGPSRSLTPVTRRTSQAPRRETNRAGRKFPPPRADLSSVHGASGGMRERSSAS